MNFKADLLINPFSYILGAVSFIGFFIVARNEIMLWLHDLLSKRRAAAVGCGAISPSEPNIIRPARKPSIILGLIFMGVVVSAALFTLHAKVEQLGLNINLNIFLLILLAFTMLPGGLTGMAAGAWISAAQRNHRDHLLQGLLAGMLVYLAFITLFEYTEVHLLLFLCGPAITLLVYRFSPIE